MPKIPPTLTVIELNSRLNKPGLHPVGGATGLYLRVRLTRDGQSITRTWVLRILINGKQRDMGLGRYPDISLKDARLKAIVHYRNAKEGRDPVADKRAEKARVKAEAITFQQAVEQYIEINKHSWKGAKEVAQWRGQMSNHVYARIGSKRMADITKTDTVAIFRPLWTNKMATAKRLHLRVDQVLKWSIAQGYRSGPSPAALEGLVNDLGELRSNATAQHHPALPYCEIAAFVADLRQRPALSARALEFLIMTAARSGEVRGATWREVDLQNALWTVPAKRMKGGKDHDVPLSAQAIAILESLPRGEPDTPLFFNERDGLKPMSENAMGNLLKRMGRADITVHGFRSTFRDWAGETTNHAREVIEHALAHGLPDRTERAYARGTLLEKRRNLMTEWGAYCG